MVEATQPPSPSGVDRVAAIWHGHVFLFDRPIERANYSNAVGLRLLAAAGALEALRLAINFFGQAWLPMFIRAPLYVFLALVSLRASGVSLRRIGLRPWREWNATERSYFVQMLLLTNVVFPAMFSAQLSRAFAQSSGSIILGTVFIPYLFLGFFQEVLYRGMLQLELVRRWGAFAGILASNIVYTFVQHLDYFAFPASRAIAMFAAVFAIGLVFALVYWRSGNLWIVGVMHAFGNAYIITATR